MLILQADYEHCEHPIKGISPQDAITQLNNQITIYAKGALAI